MARRVTRAALLLLPFACLNDALLSTPPLKSGQRANRHDCRRATVVASTSQERMDAFMRMRRRNEGYMGEVQGEMYDSSDPALVKLGSNGFEDSGPPVLSTKVDQIRPGIFTGYLIWDSEAHFGPGNDAEVKVGKSIFHTNSPEEAAMGLEQELGIKVGYLKNVEIVPGLRGQKGGIIMMAAMIKVFEEEGGMGDADMVLLSHLDVKQGQLIRYYETMGFMKCSEIPWDDPKIEDIVREATLMVTDFGQFRRTINSMMEAAGLAIS